MPRLLQRVDNKTRFYTILTNNDSGTPNPYTEMHLEWRQFLSALVAEDNSTYAQTGQVILDGLENGKKLQCFQEFNLDFDLSEALARKFLRFVAVGTQPLDYYVMRDQLIRFHDRLIAVQVEVPKGATPLGASTGTDPRLKEAYDLVDSYNRQISGLNNLVKNPIQATDQHGLFDTFGGPDKSPTGTITTLNSLRAYAANLSGSEGIYDGIQGRELEILQFKELKSVQLEIIRELIKAGVK